MGPNDTSEHARVAQIEALRALSNRERGALAMRLSDNAIALSRRAIRRANPLWSDFDVQVEWARLHYGPEIAAMIARWVERQPVE